MVNFKDESGQESLILKSLFQQECLKRGILFSGGHNICYSHTDDDIDRVAVVDTHGEHWPRILASGHDFYMQPRFSPDSRQLAFVAWDHPNMPWDGTTAYLLDLEFSGPGLPSTGEPRRLAGGDDVAIFQPEFSADGKHLLYVSDESGWGRLACQDLMTGGIRWLTTDGTDYGTPAWAQDMRTFAVCGDGRSVVATAGDAGFHRLVHIDLARRSFIRQAAKAYVQDSGARGILDIARSALGKQDAATPSILAADQCFIFSQNHFTKTLPDSVSLGRHTVCEPVALLNETSGWGRGNGRAEALDILGF